jgi:hypothetical protein
MNRHWETEELIDFWTLLPPELEILANKTGATYAASFNLAFETRTNYTDGSGDFLFSGREIGGAHLVDLKR